MVQEESKQQLPIDLPRIPTNNGAGSRSGWTKIPQMMYENVHSNLALVPLLRSIAEELEEKASPLCPLADPIVSSGMST